MAKMQQKILNYYGIVFSNVYRLYKNETYKHKIKRSLPKKAPSTAAPSHDEIKTRF